MAWPLDDNSRATDKGHDSMLRPDSELLAHENINKPLVEKNKSVNSRKSQRFGRENLRTSGVTDSEHLGG